MAASNRLAVLATLALAACTSSKSDASRDAAVDAPSIDAATNAPPSTLDATVDAPPEASAPRCDAGVYSADAGGCVECVTSTDCTSGVCDTEHHECVQCNETSDCTDTLCNTATHQCVQCLTHNDCSATTPVCGATGMCEGCTTRTQCDRFAGTTPACQTSTGQCKACDPSAETATTAGDCGANSCNPDSWSCTGTGRGSRLTCDTCMADSECPITSDGTHRCVVVDSMVDGGTPSAVCVVDKATRGGGVGGSCPLRLRSEAELTSTSGTTSTYCLPRTGYATCQAIAASRTATTCTDSSMCSPGAICDGTVCAVACLDGSDCVSGQTCSGSPATYCH